MLSTPTCYVSPKLKGQTLSNGSKATFACLSIKKDELLAILAGEAITYEQLLELPSEPKSYTLQVEDNIYLLTINEGPGDWINHSCNPNAGLDGQIALRAMRDIAPGEHICFDYAMADSSSYDEFECQCGSPNCRGRITGNDWQIPELWQRYAGYFSPYLQRRIDQLKATQFSSTRPTRRRRRAYQFA